MKKTNLHIYLLLTLSMIFWSISYIWSKIVFTLYTPITTIFLRLILASTLFLIIGFFSGKLQAIKKKDLGSIFLLAFLQPFLYFLGENLGLYHLTPTVVAIIVSTIPLFVAFAEAIFFKTKLYLINYIGIIISIVGVFLVLLRGDNFTLTMKVTGIGYLIIAIFAAVVYSVMIVKNTKKYSPFTLITYQNLIGIFYFLPLFLIFDYAQFKTIKITPNVLQSLVCLAFFSSSLAFIFFVYGLKKIGIAKASIFGNTIPAFTAAFSFFLLGESLNPLNILGIMVVILGIFLSQIKTGKTISYIPK